MTIFIWIGFLVFILAMLLLDLGVFHRKEHVISIREALSWTTAWIAMALIFNVFVYFLYQENWLGWTDIASHHLTGKEAALKFLNGYVIEKSLSVDNIFVIAMIFAFLKVPSSMQHRVLFWGILGALILRGLMIGIGAALVARFDWIMYLFGALLIYSAIKMLSTEEDDIHPDNNLFVRAARKLMTVTSEYHGNHFFVRIDGKTAATPLFMALLLVESCDVMFAVDSIPAIFGITTDPFLVFTSNIFAILGLRSLFFAVAGLMDIFKYLKVSLVFLLMYVGIKMILHRLIHIPDLASLAIIVTILGLGVVASLLSSSDAEIPDESIIKQNPLGKEDAPIGDDVDTESSAGNAASVEEVDAEKKSD